MKMLEFTLLNVVIFTIIFTIYLYVQQYYETAVKRRPPGPLRFPLIGTLTQIFFVNFYYPYDAFAKFAKKYGNVISIQLGVVDIVVINGLETIKKALHGEDFLERFDADWFLHRSFGKRIGLLPASKEFWRPTRRFTMRHLREFGFGKKQAMQEFANAELQDIMKVIDNIIVENDGVLEPRSIFQIPGVNMAWASVAGHRFDPEDPKMKELMRLLIAYVTHPEFAGVTQAYPIFAKLLPKFFNFDKLYEVDDEMQAFLQLLVDEARAKGSYKTDPQSFLDMFLQQIDKPDDSQTDGVDGVFTDENLVTILYDIFIAGSDTTASSMGFALLYLAFNPTVQEKLYQEINNVIGDKRAPQLTDKPRLPYTRATVLEIHRRSHVLPLLPHKVYRDTEFEGWIVPEGTFVMINQYSVQMDKDFWGDPERFRPERFLDSDGNVVNEHRLLTFSTGKRNCIGEAVAEISIFSFLTALVQKYKFEPANLGEKTIFKPKLGMALSPAPQTIRVRQRR